MSVNPPLDVTSRPEAARPSRDSLGCQLCDAALAAYQSLPADGWRGRHPFPGGEIVFADRLLARQYALAGQHALNVNHDLEGAIRLLEASMRLDYAGTLEADDVLMLRVEAYHARGDERPARAVLLYNLGVTFGRRRCWREAGAAYRASADFDPVFAWHLNNFAWMAATAPDPAAHAGSLAVALAQHTCISTGFGCWAFIGTLAAAYARTGDFDRAVAWQRVARTLTPAGERAFSEQRLATYEAGQAYLDLVPRPIGGDDDNNEGTDTATLWGEAEALMGVSRGALH